MTHILPSNTLAMPAEAARLNLSFDPARLLDELQRVRTHTWSAQRMYDKDGVGAATSVDWRCLALRAPGGDGGRTDPGGPGPEDFADTDWLDQLPYHREVLGQIPAPLHTVRLMALGPDTIGIDHPDPKYGPRWGVTRLHIPLVTNPHATLVLDGIEHRWQPGEFWFGDFSRVHRVENHGEDTRVHLVIDTLVTPALSRLFPTAWADYFDRGNVLYNRPEQPQTADERRRLACVFELPESFLLWEDFHDLDAEAPRVRVALEDTGGQLALVPPSGRAFALVHLGSNEYRLAGWSEERTLQFYLDVPQPQVVLRLREGRDAQQLAVALDLRARQVA